MDDNSEDNLELKCRKAVLKIADYVSDIKQLLSHFIENYRHDYYNALNGINYQKQLKQYQDK